MCTRYQKISSKNDVFREKTQVQYIKTTIAEPLYKITFLSLDGARRASRRNLLADRKIFKHCQKSAKMSDGIPSRRNKSLNDSFSRAAAYLAFIVF
jgi:hypothetical protein